MNKKYKSRILKQYESINKLLYTSPLVIVDGKTTNEQINVNYNYFFSSEELENEIKIIHCNPQSEDDRLERSQIIVEINNKKNIFLKDINSRQFVIQKKYNNADIASCMPFIQFLVRYNSVLCFVALRSQNIDNFLYDNESILLYCKHIMDEFKYEKVGIYVRIVSMHKYGIL